MRQFTLIPLLGLLAACATPQEACISRATKNLRTMNSLIAETQANVERGYAIKREPYTSYQHYACPQKNTDGTFTNGFCRYPTTQYRNINLAIDPAAEQQKLRNMKLKRDQLAQKAQAQVKACQAAYPEP